MISFSKFLKEQRFSQIVALLLLLLLLLIGAIPGYLTGHWQWQELPRITRLQELKDSIEEAKVCNSIFFRTYLPTLYLAQ